MSTQTCGGCRHFCPHLNPVTGRICPTKWGECGWKPPKTIWPMAFRRSGVGSWEADPFIRPVRVGAWTNADACRCWESPPAKGSAHVDQHLFDPSIFNRGDSWANLGSDK